MTYFVILRGPAGSGKTTIARQLAKQLKAHYISFDTIMSKSKLDKIKNGNIPEKNFLEGNEIAIKAAEKCLSKNKPVVFDGCFYYKLQIKHLAKNFLYKHFAFTLKANLHECIDRDKKRKNKIGKKNIEAVYKLVTKFNYGKTIDTNGKSANEIIKKIIAII